MNDQQPLDRLICSSTSQKNSTDASSLGETTGGSHMMSHLEPSLFDLTSNSDLTLTTGYYGFRTRHLSCIEENDSDSFNSLASDLIQETTDHFASHELEKQSQWGIDEDVPYVNESMCNSFSSGTFPSVRKNLESPRNERVDFNSVLANSSQITLNESSVCSSPYKDFVNGIMNRCPDSMMTRSCYGSLPIARTEEPQPLKNSSNEPIYAVIDKEIQNKYIAKKMTDSIASNYESQATTGSENIHDVFNLSDYNAVNKDVTTNESFGECKNMGSLEIYDTSRNARVSSCPSCSNKFDKDKRRKLIDSCGHERCYSCMFANEKCPFCFSSDFNGLYIKNGVERSTKSPTATSEMIQSYESVRYSSPDQSFTKSPVTAIEVPITSNINTDANRKPKTSTDINDKYGKHSQPATPSHTPRKKNFTAKGFRKTFGGHRRTSSHGSIETPTSLSDCSVMDSSFHSDSVISKPRKHSSSHHNYNKSNGIHFTKATGHLSSLVFGKIKSLWSAQTNNAGLNQLADVKSGSECKMMETKPDSEKSSFNVDGTEKSEIYEQVYMKPPRKTAQNNISQRITTNIRNIKDWSSKRQQKTPPPPTDQSAEILQESTYNSLQNTLQCLALKPLFFEVPLLEPDPPFFGRQWILRDISNTLTTTEMPGVLITGCPGSGKTSLILQLVDYSCFGRKKGTVAVESEGIYCQINVSHDRIKSLASQVVAYHFCQAENNRTCLVPDFVHSLSAQLCQAPQLSAYREHLLNEVHLQSILSIQECIANPEQVMILGILEPLTALKSAGRINVKQCFLLIDAICEAESFRADYGFTISSFLVKMASCFPSWFKIIATVRSDQIETVKGLPYMKLTLDNWESNENVQKDVSDYVSYRLKHSPDIEGNLKCSKETNMFQTFVDHLSYAAKGSFLYAKFALDLIERGHLVLKSCKALPLSLSQLYILELNGRFSSAADFEKVSNMLCVCLASLTPLTLSEIYYTVVALSTADPISWNDFLQLFKLLDRILVKRIDGTYMFFHPSFREWLMVRGEGESTRYLADFRKGHYAIAFRMARLQAPLDAEQTLELTHHILKARVYRCLKPVQHSLRDVQAYWVASVSQSVTSALSAVRNVYKPDVKTCKLLLLAGADPNTQLEQLDGSTILCVAAYEGMTTVVSALLEFGADIRRPNRLGRTPLILASMQGHIDIVRLLVASRCNISQCDNDQECALVHAVRRGNASVVKYLLICDWTVNEGSDTRTLYHKAVSDSFLIAASHKHLDIIEDILDIAEINVDTTEVESGDTALIKAASYGHSETASLLLSRGAEIDKRNKDNVSAMIFAVRKGHCNMVELLIERKSDIDQTDLESGKSSLIIASEEGHLDIVKVLVENGADLEKKDSNGLTALSWACLQGRYHVVKYMLEKGSNIDTTDNFNRSPLDFAAYQGTLRLIKLLLDSGATVQHVDENGVTPIDRAVACRNIPAIQAFLKIGAAIGPTTWALAEESPDILLLFINHVIKNGNSLLKRHLLQEASQKFKFALNKIATIEHSTTNQDVITQLLYNLLLSSARCKRKTNDLPEAIHLATRAIALIPIRYEGYYVRAKAYFSNGIYENAFQDISSALEKADSVSLYIKDILEKTRLDIESKARTFRMIVKESTEL